MESESPIPIPHAEVIFESPTTIVFRGDLIDTLQLKVNTQIWEAIDFLKNEGFKLDQILTTGAGSKGNPHDLYVIMSK